MTEQQKQQYLKELRQKQLIGSSNLTQTDALIEDRKKKQNDLDNIEEATKKFFNNDTTIKP